MITLKKYKELETEVLNNGVKCNYGRTATPLNSKYLEEMFDKKVIIIEKMIKNLDKNLDNMELKGIYHSHECFLFSMGKHYNLTIIARNPKIVINFFDKKNSMKGFFFDLEKQLLFPVRITDEIRNSSYKHKYKFLDSLRYTLEADITNKMKNSDITDKIINIQHKLVFLAHFLYMNYEATYTHTPFMNYSFNLNNIEECIEIECLNNDFIKPTLKNQSQSLKNK